MPTAPATAFRAVSHVHRPSNQFQGCQTCPLPLQQRSGLSHTCTDLATSFRAAKHAHCPSHRTTICTATHHSRNLQRTPQDKARGNATFSRRRHSSWLPHAALITSSHRPCISPSVTSSAPGPPSSMFPTPSQHQGSLPVQATPPAWLTLRAQVPRLSVPAQHQDNLLPRSQLLASTRAAFPSRPPHRPG